MSKRPIGITSLALALGWLSLSGFFFAFLAPLDQIPPPVTFSSASATALKFSSFFYGLFALSSCLGLLKRLSWARFTFWGWIASCAGLFVLLMLVVPSELMLGGNIGALVVGVFIALMLAMLDRYVRGYLKHAI